MSLHCVNSMVRIFITCLKYLNVTIVLHLAENCAICGVQGTEFCADCEELQQGIKFSETFCYFCKDCVTLWHKHQDRRHHKPVSRYPYNDVDDPGGLQLLSVLCIETSQYVCFTRVQGSGRNEWVFFDGMAERPGTKEAMYA